MLCISSHVGASKGLYSMYNEIEIYRWAKHRHAVYPNLVISAELAIDFRRNDIFNCAPYQILRSSHNNQEKGNFCDWVSCGRFSIICQNFLGEHGSFSASVFICSVCVPMGKPTSYSTLALHLPQIHTRIKMNENYLGE